MKIPSFLLAMLTFAAVGCNPATSPSTPAEAPATGTIFTYHVDGTTAPYDISYTIEPRSDGFKAVDSDGAEIDYKLYANGDIGWSCSCDWLEMGIQSHRAFRTRASSTPMKFNGTEFKGWIHFESKYLGQDAIAVAGKTYDCSKIEVDGVVQENDTLAAPHIGSLVTYWYTPSLKYFTRIESKQYVHDSLVGSSVMQLVSVK